MVAEYYIDHSTRPCSAVLGYHIVGDDGVTDEIVNDEVAPA